MRGVMQWRGPIHLCAAECRRGKLNLEPPLPSLAQAADTRRCCIAPMQMLRCSIWKSSIFA